MKPDGRTCAYRGTGGRKCAIGQLVTDEEAADMDDDIKWEESTGIMVLLRTGAVIPSLEGLDARWLSELQAIHDTALDMEEGLRDFAFRHRLSVPA